MLIPRGAGSTDVRSPILYDTGGGSQGGRDGGSCHKDGGRAGRVQGREQGAAQSGAHYPPPGGQDPQPGGPAGGQGAIPMHMLHCEDAALVSITLQSIQQLAFAPSMVLQKLC